MCLTGKRAVAWIQSFLKLVGRKGRKKDPVCLVLLKESVGTQQRWGNHDERQRRIHSGRDEGGSAANRVRDIAIVTE
jgi:hypothetical protein